MSTQFLYLYENSTTQTATVTNIIESQVPIVCLDRTIFYPNTGSQRGDRGYIGNSRVLSVELNGSTIYHYVESTQRLLVGSVVDLKVDDSWRTLQSTYHSAGHLLMYAADYVLPHCSLSHAQHWPDHAVVSLISDRAATPREQFVMERFMEEIISADLSVVCATDDVGRYVSFGHFRKIYCNGTHITRTKDCGCVSIVKSEFRENRLDLHYRTQQL